MLRLALLPCLTILAAALARAQPACPPTPAYQPCDLVFELSEAEAAQHPNPYLTVELRGEFRSPRARTLLLSHFWDGGRRLIIRFTPTDPGEWAYRLTSNLARLNGQSGTVTATEATTPGFVVPANVHHWATSNKQPHLWMGDTNYQLATIEPERFARWAQKRSEQRFTHLRGLVLGSATTEQPGFDGPDRPNPTHFQRLDANVLALNRSGITADLVLGADQDHVAKLFPTPAQRERYVRYVAARYGPLNVTWQGVQEFEEYRDGRALLRDVGKWLQQFDAYQHPRTTHTTATSSPLLSDGWMNFLAYQSSDDDLGVIEHQLYAVPQVNTEFGYEDSGAGRALPHHVDADTFRRRLWNATMNGQYPTFGNTGTYGGRFVLNDKYLESPGTKAMTAWFELLARTRHWELEPYFEVDGGRAVALPGVEYLVYVEKPAGPVEVTVERHGYDVSWINPATGEASATTDYKGEKFVGEAPNRDHDWLLHIERRGTKESMLRSYKFDSRPVLLQEVEAVPARVPFEVAEPKAEQIPAGQPVPYLATLKRQTRGTRLMRYLWLGEVAADGQGARVLGTGEKGMLRVPKSIVRGKDPLLNLRVLGMNAYGKVYAVERIVRLVP